MSVTTVLLVSTESTELDFMEQALQGEGYALLRSRNRDDTMTLLATQGALHSR